jgi:predicted dehydrogenase
MVKSMIKRTGFLNIRFFDACIKRSGSPEYLGLEDALVMTKMIEAVYQSDKTGHTVQF